MLLKSDIIIFKRIDFILFRQVAIINSYKIKASIETRVKDFLMPRFIYIKKAVVVPFNSSASIEINYLNLFKKDFLFNPVDIKLFIYTGLVSQDFYQMLV